MKKKLLSVLLAASLVMGLAACGNKTAENPAPAPEGGGTEAPASDNTGGGY